jgi:hypothetical protein
VQFPGLTFVLVLVLCAPTFAQRQADHLPEAIADRQNTRYQGLTAKQRLGWVVKGTVGPRSLGIGLFTSALATASNRPDEYGPHWDGFGKRYAMRLTGIATERVMEAGLGALWGEDPRYFRSSETAFKPRLKHVVAMTFEAKYDDGQIRPAYARLIAIPGSSYLSNTWRADSVATHSDALKRAAFGFLGKMTTNALAEFGPDLKTLVTKKKSKQNRSASF